MKNLEDTLHAIGFSKELIGAIKETPQLESQEIDVDNTLFETFENEIYSSTEINLIGRLDTFNYYGNET